MSSLLSSGSGVLTLSRESNNKKISPNQEAFWKAYIFTLQEEIMPSPNPDQIFFPALQSTVGVLAGDEVPAEVTNYGIYKWANGAMSPSQPLYLGGGDGSYINCLEKYLSNVDVGSNPSRGLFEAYLKAVKLSTQAKQDYFRELKQASDMYKLDPGSYATIDEWALENDPSFGEAKEAWQSAIGQEESLRLQVYGPAADQKSKALRSINLLALSTTSQPGYNMPTTADNVQLSDADALALAKGDKVAFPPFVKMYSPAYSIQGDYKDFVSDCASKMTDGQLQPESCQIDIERYANADWEERGFTDVTGEGILGYFIAAEAEYSRKDEFEKTFNNMAASDYSVTLDVYGRQIFELEAGQWDVPDVGRVYPNLEKDTPVDIMDFFQPKAVAVAYTIGMKVQFRDRYASEFNSHFKSIQEVEGGIVIFGISLELGGKRTSETEKTTHTATYDESSGVLTIHPNNDGHAILLGMVGQRADPPPAPERTSGPKFTLSAHSR
ncbi:hypothetical protein TWF281_004678 [Arthrobotrys megalospora]